MKRNLHLFLAVLALALAVGFLHAADAPVKYEDAVAKARQLMNDGKLAEAYLAASAAITLDEKRWEAYALTALILNSQGATKEAGAFEEKALARAPEEKKPNLRDMARRYAQAPASEPDRSGPPSQLTGETRRKYDALLLIIEEADKAKAGGERVKLLREFMVKSAEFLALAPLQTNIWVTRGAVAVELDYPGAGFLVGRRLKELGLENSESPAMRKVLAALERKGWLGKERPLRDWSKRSMDQVKTAASDGDEEDQYALGYWYENGRSGLAKDEVAAVKWYRKAAEQGNADAKVALERLQKDDQTSKASQLTGSKSKPGKYPAEEAVILTPKPSPSPRINGPCVTGARPGNPLLFRVPVTGTRPMSFSADGLPNGLQLDTSTGIISGVTPPRGEYRVTLRAKNAHGETTRGFRIVAGDTLALTPPMGWNPWYTHYDRITDQLMREAAEAMVSSGMADVGYQYLNIDDCWMNADKSKDPLRNGPFRDGQGNILPNHYFPNMKAMTDYIHAKGLKAGIYTSPGPKTCAGFAGAYQYEGQDAKQFADWGFDFLKYDWCSYGGVLKNDKSLTALKKPYELMGDLLKQQKRDIVFNLCQYGMGDVWEWGAAVGGHCWRTAGDLGFELDRIFPVALKNAEHRAFSKPGAWNDPDYIQIGLIGDARSMGEPIQCPLTPNEQFAFMSLWCLSAAPLFYSGDIGKLDEFTVNVLCNAEVIDVDQDPLGQCAKVVFVGEDTFLMVKDMEDGSKAVGLFNRGEKETIVAAKWSEVGVTSKQLVRDLWRQKDLGQFENLFSTAVPRHGGVLLRFTATKR